MSKDATFEEGGEAPLNLGALDVEDLKVIAALVQDAVFPASEMAWRAGERRFVMLINRFRWEDAAHSRHGPERVRSLLVIDQVLRVSSQGIDRKDRDMILSLLDVAYHAGEDGAGYVELVLAGDGAIRLDVEALEVSLKDVTRPYKAPSKKVPAHDI
jgi:hypothetical protein